MDLRGMTPEQLGEQFVLALKTNDTRHIKAIMDEVARRTGLAPTKRNPRRPR